MTRPPKARVLAIDAARSVVRDKGVTGLTIDAVAETAGVSKGGVLYHFPSKDELVEGVLADNIDRFIAAVEVAAETDPEPVGRWTRAYLTATIEVGGPELELLPLIRELPASPSRERWGEAVRSWIERDVASGLSSAVVSAAMLAADGVWIARSFQSVVFTDDVTQQALQWIDEQVRATRP